CLQYRSSPSMYSF
nr:immunoglobulin light chain junction region [Macaca mulatta]MOX23686.1 immunoglobulin light chain junction region [Macaca mulatta]MOX23795.1 immunoglobulin light chain junction region [Macaca mulatta]MOX24329.1 immunoglobulin light chain junction region [Macaca mulatta]MOX24361.1 immunoglobulin light chain junction region [Macaca mulatta]